MLDNGKVRSNERYDHFRCITCQNCAAVCPEDAITIEGDYRVTKGYWKNDHLFEEGKSLPAPFSDMMDRDFSEYEDQLTETERVIFKRRSVRLYRKKQVPEEMVRRVIEAGRYAPSAGNNQPWKFIVIQNRETIDEIDRKCKEFYRKAMVAIMPHPWIEKKIPGDKNAKLKLWQKAIISAFIRFRGPGEVDQRARGGTNAIVADPNYHTFFNAPTLILLLADKRGVGSIEIDTGIAGQNMVLAAHALGLGTCWVALIGGLKQYPEYMEELGISPAFEVVSSLTLGYPRGQVDNIVKREKARVTWIK
jgi:nitroreductase